MLAGVKYRFLNPDKEGWIGRGGRRAVILRPTIVKLNDSEELGVEACELQNQLDNNSALSEADKQLLGARLATVQRKLGALPDSPASGGMATAQRQH